MERGSAFRFWSVRFSLCSQIRPRPLAAKCCSTNKRRLFVESLEDRHLLAALTDGTAPLSSLDVDPTAHSTSSLIVQFRAGTSSPGSLAAYTATASVDSEWALTPGMRKVELNANADWASTLLAFKLDPNVQYVEPNYHVQLQLAPNDPDLGQDWGLDNLGQTGGVEDADIDAPEAWDVSTGSTKTVVAVIDTGVDYNHPDLYENIWINQGEIPASRKANFTDVDGDGLITFYDLNDPVNQGPFMITDVNHDGRIDGSDLLAPMSKTGGQDNGNGGWKDGADTDHNGKVDDFVGYNFVGRSDDPMDDHFHGTHVAGTIGAIGDNGVGTAGVNWHVQIMALKFLDASGGGYESDAIDALNYAVANGAVVSNNSWGGGGASTAFQTAIQNAADAGHIFVAAAGNDGTDNDQYPFYPAGYSAKPVDNVISVAATDASDQLAWFSNYGSKSVDLAAPGVNIYSTFPTHVTQAMQDEGFGPNYGTISGTSMATPHVTGAVALVYTQVHSQHPDWTNKQIMPVVIDQVLGGVDVIPAADHTVTGGRLNVAAALGIRPPDSSGPRVLSNDPSGQVTGTVDHVTLKFSEPIDPATFTLDDIVSMNGPSGPINVTSIVPVSSSNRQFAVMFDPQTDLGDYSLVIGPNIADTSGNLLDQNKNGIGGEDPDDDATATFSIADVVGYPSTDVPVPIDSLENSVFGNGPAISTLTIDQDITITDLNIQLNVNYTDSYELAIYLQSPSGTLVALTGLQETPGDGFADTIFDDQASMAITDPNALSPYPGSYRPDDRLSAFNGESAAGTWTLMVEAEPIFNLGQGWLNSWSITLQGDGGGPPPPPPPPPPPDNEPPEPGDDSLQGTTNSVFSVTTAELLVNDTDPNGDALSITFVGNPTNGSVSLDDNQLITFAPKRDFQGQATFQYLVTDGSLTATGHVTIDFEPSFQWHNDTAPEDVDNNGFVSPSDALAIINMINAQGPGPLVFLNSGAKPSTFVDVDADNFLAPNDAVAVINYINAHPVTGSSVMASDAYGSVADAALMSLLASKKPDGGLL